jgi:hypothetical protein
MNNEDHPEQDHLELYGDDQIASYHGIIPNWLKFQYVLWIIWGIIWFALYWNGSWGYLDRGYWQELQRAANTKFPMITTSLNPKE